MNKLVEWELTLKCNYECGYCGLLDTSIKPELDEEKLYNFIESLHHQYPTTEIFLFGGEPFLHPKIEFIINTFLYFKQPFVVQTNFSKYSVDKMIEIDREFNINVSIHPSQSHKLDLVNSFKKQLKVNIKNIDIMYDSVEALSYYGVVNKVAPIIPTLTPVSDIGCTGYNKVLEEYNYIKQTSVYQKLYNFENIERTFNGVTKQRSLIWEDFNNGEITYGSKCLYLGNYFLYDPSLNLHNCCYRKTTTGTCENSSCFLM